MPGSNKRESERQVDDDRNGGGDDGWIYSRNNDCLVVDLRAANTDLLFQDKPPNKIIVQRYVKSNKNSLKGIEHEYVMQKSVKPQEKQKVILAPYLTIWKEAYGGYFPAVRFAKMFRDAEKDHGKEQVLNAFENYCKSTEINWASISSFCSKINRWLKHSDIKKTERVDEKKQWRD
jgi:hypothetical protein